MDEDTKPMDGIAAKAIAEWQDVVKEVFTLEEQLKEAKERQRRYELTTLPQMFDERGWSGIKLNNGRMIEIKDSLHVSLVKGAGRIEAIQFIRDSGNAGSIKQEIKIEAEEVEGAMAILNDHGVAFEVEETIHPQTLKSLVSELIGLKDGTTRYTVDELPKGLGAYLERKVELK